MIRGLDTTVKRLRRKVFEEVARLGFEANDETLCDDMEAIPYAMVNEESPVYRDSIYRARAVVRERLRLAMGLSLRPENKPVHRLPVWRRVIFRTNTMSRRLCRSYRQRVQHVRNVDMK